MTARRAERRSRTFLVTLAGVGHECRVHGRTVGEAKLRAARKHPGRRFLGVREP